ncbi:PREDICTED: uncharacterized protein LOC105506544 [Colobus angolensis palliatus]|uniref:uncharacterized protein LOC105506544 n=1 Tax=Colobus angolensis palliatus TaxID=336983 RepID=UPI0005F403F9|nr:PREDICTED: uncharacterized protein LOC105506544 [Colobus angolensis palliatus]
MPNKQEKQRYCPFISASGLKVECVVEDLRGLLALLQLPIMFTPLSRAVLCKDGVHKRSKQSTKPKNHLQTGAWKGLGTGGKAEFVRPGSVIVNWIGFQEAARVLFVIESPSSQSLVRFLLGIPLPSRTVPHLPHLSLVHLMLTFPVLLWRVLILPLLTLPQQGEEVQLEKLPVPPFRCKEWEKDAAVTALGSLLQELTARVLLLWPFILLSGFNFPTSRSHSLSFQWIPETQRREECGLHFTSLPSLALDLKFHTTEPNTSRYYSGCREHASRELWTRVSGASAADSRIRVYTWPVNGELVSPLRSMIRDTKLCLATDKLFQCPWDLQDVWNEERQLSQDGELSGGPQKNVLCGRRVFPIRQTVLQPRPPKRSNLGLLFSGTECGCILPFLCFLLQYLLMVHTWGLGKLGT